MVAARCRSEQSHVKVLSPRNFVKGHQPLYRRMLPFTRNMVKIFAEGQPCISPHAVLMCGEDKHIRQV